VTSEPVVLLYTNRLSEAEREPFRAAAHANLAAARNALDGALCYEWFLAPDGSSGAMIEAYASNEAFLAHLAAQRAAKAPPAPGSGAELLIAGGLDERMKATVGRWPGVRYFGPRLCGLLELRRSPIEAGAIGPEAIFLTAVLNVPETLRPALTEALGEAVEAVARGEPDTLAYEWFSDAAGAQLRVFEIYRNETARQAHHAKIAPRLRQMFQALDSSTRYYGALTGEARLETRTRMRAEFGGERFAGLRNDGAAAR
jgi:quinol monooxygenase YgiN